MGGGPQRVHPITIVVPVRRWWAWWLRLSWPGAQRFPIVKGIVKGPLLRLSFINFAYWSLWDRDPAGDKRGRPKSKPLVVFQTNFNGPVDPYVGAFVHVVAGRIALLWGGAYNFPGPKTPGRLYDYAVSRVQPVQHFYCAYPAASATMVGQALELDERLGAFAARTRGLGDDEFAAEYRRFVTDVQGLL